MQPEIQSQFLIWWSDKIKQVCPDINKFSSSDSLLYIYNTSLIYTSWLRFTGSSYISQFKTPSLLTLWKKNSAVNGIDEDISAIRGTRSAGRRERHLAGKLILPEGRLTSIQNFLWRNKDKNKEERRREWEGKEEVGGIYLDQSQRASLLDERCWRDPASGAKLQQPAQQYMHTQAHTHYTYIYRSGTQVYRWPVKVYGAWISS